MNLVLLLAAAFLLGAVPFAFLAVKLVFGKDVREFGSRNPGTTNASRMWSKRWQLPAFLVIFCLDAGKGFVATALLPGWFGGPAEWAPALAGAAAVLGHVFTPFLRLKGGKGVATTLGVLAGLEPFATTVGVAVFLLIFAATRIVAAGSLGVAIALPVAVLLHGRAPQAVFLLTVVLGLLIIVRHRENIANMVRGEEP